MIVASANGREALAEGMAVLRRGGTALDAVEACARIVEADPRDESVGLGGLPNLLGVVELDASIMDGTTLRAGAVGALQGFLHPITVARAVMDRLPHVLLVGAGAARFARESGAEPAELLTDAARRYWEDRLRALGESASDIGSRGELATLVRPVREHGTVNFIARDAKGGLASAVTTSGWALKYPGRLGDSPVIGAGNYADARAGAATCTGFGESALRCGTARIAVDRMARGISPRAAARSAVADASAIALKPFHVLALGADGAHAAASNVAGRSYAVIEDGMAEAVLVPRDHLHTAGPDGSPLSGELWDRT